MGFLDLLLVLAFLLLPIISATVIGPRIIRKRQRKLLFRRMSDIDKIIEEKPRSLRH
ncbi:MAG: hypothetical protein ACE5OY_01845 [Candidatus Bathyarchaeia archaeon]